MRMLKRILLTASAVAFAITATIAQVVPLKTQVVAEAATMKINKKLLTLEEGDTYKLKVKGIGKKKVKWSSSDTYVAKVSKSGNVKAVSEGSATIKAKVGKKAFKCKVYVEPVDDYNEDNGQEHVPVLSEIQKNKNDFLQTIKTEGYYNQNGHWAMKYNAGTNTMPVVQYLEDKDALEFSFLDITSSVMTTCSFELPMQQDNPVVNIKAGVSYKDFDLDGTLTVNASDVYFNDSNSAMTFVAYQSKGYATSERQQELLNSAGNFAFTVWDVLVDVYAYSSFSKIGLTRLTTSGAVGSPAELVEYDDSTPFGKLWNYVKINGSLDDDGHKVLSGDYYDGHYTTGLVTITNYEDTHTIQMMDTFVFTDGDKKATGCMVFDIDKEGESAGIIVSYRDETRGNGYKAVTRNFDPSTYLGRKTKLYFYISDNTTNFYDYEESDFTSKSVVPNCLEDINVVLNKYGFNLQDLGFKQIVMLK